MHACMSHVTCHIMTYVTSSQSVPGHPLSLDPSLLLITTVAPARIAGQISQMGLGKTRGKHGKSPESAPGMKNLKWSIGYIGCRRILRILEFCPNPFEICEMRREKMEKQVEDVANVHPILVENLPTCRRVFGMFF